MRQSVYLLVGVPCSGKSWVCDRLDGSKYNVVRHDDHIGGDYVAALTKAAHGDRSVVGETPFSITQIAAPLTKAGIEVKPVFVMAGANELRARYRDRKRNEYANGNLTRQRTYEERAKEYKAFSGSSSEVLEYLNGRET